MTEQQKPQEEQQPNQQPQEQPQHDTELAEEFVRTPTSDATDPRPAGQKAKVSHETKEKK
jgi:hypothetical protein